MSQSSKVILGIVIALVVILGGYSLLKAPKPGEVENTNAGTDTVVNTNESAPVENKEPIKIGFIGPLGAGSDVAALGNAARAGVEIAVEEVNATGGINGRPLEVIYEDGQCNAKTATNAASKLVTVDKVPVIVGGLCSTETSAFVPIAMENKVVVMSYCSSAPSLSKTGKYFFRDYPSDAYQGKFAAEYAYNTLKVKKVAVIYHISEWGTGLKDTFTNRFKELGGEIIAEEGTPQDARDYRTILTKVNGLKPDLIYFPAYTEGSIAAINQAKELQITTQIFGGDAWADPKFQQEASSKANIIYTEVITPAAPDGFKSQMLTKTGSNQVPICAPQAYDAIKLLSIVMMSVGTDTEKMQESLHNFVYNGISGSISFDANGDLTKAEYLVKKIENGTATEVK